MVAAALSSPFELSRAVAGSWSRVVVNCQRAGNGTQKKREKLVGREARARHTKLATIWNRRRELKRRGLGAGEGEIVAARRKKRRGGQSWSVAADRFFDSGPGQGRG